MNRTELESFVTLKYYPLSYTREYINSLPYRTVTDYTFGRAQPNATEDWSREQMYQVFRTFNGANIKVEDTWNKIKNLLLEYYEQTGI